MTDAFRATSCACQVCEAAREARRRVEVRSQSVIARAVHRLRVIPSSAVSILGRTPLK